MEFLGIGPLELLFIVLIALIILGPQDMVKAGHTVGRLLRKTILSPTWLTIQKKVRTLPYEMMREAGLDDLNTLRDDIKANYSSQSLYTPIEASKNPIPPNPAVESSPSEPLPAEWTSQTIIDTPEAPPEAASDIPDEWTTPPAPSSLPAAYESPSQPAENLPKPESASGTEQS